MQSLRGLRLSPQARCFHALIDGELKGAASSFGVINPATGKEFARCPEVSHDQVRTVRWRV